MAQQCDGIRIKRHVLFRSIPRVICLGKMEKALLWMVEVCILLALRATCSIEYIMCVSLSLRN